MKAILRFDVLVSQPLTKEMRLQQHDGLCIT